MLVEEFSKKISYYCLYNRQQSWLQLMKRTQRKHKKMMIQEKEKMQQKQRQKSLMTMAKRKKNLKITSKNVSCMSGTSS